tara:strand:- start:220 stop:468 length:249 start_codon:yes stop_codon:yes gene_type:complete
MGSPKGAGLLHLVLLIGAMVIGQATFAKNRTSSIRFVGQVPATCQQQQRHQASDHTTDPARSVRYTTWNTTGDYRQMTCVVY